MRRAPRPRARADATTRAWPSSGAPDVDCAERTPTPWGPSGLLAEEEHAVLNDGGRVRSGRESGLHIGSEDDDRERATLDAVGTRRGGDDAQEGIAGRILPRKATIQLSKNSSVSSLAPILPGASS